MLIVRRKHISAR